METTHFILVPRDQKGTLNYEGPSGAKVPGRAVGPFESKQALCDWAEDHKDHGQIVKLEPPKPVETPQQKVERLLNDLAQSPDSITTRLGSKGVQGRACEPESCPITNYLRLEVPEVKSTNYETCSLNLGAVRVEVPVPVAVRNWIQTFDRMARLVA